MTEQEKFYAFLNNVVVPIFLGAVFGPPIILGVLFFVAWLL